MVCTEKRQEGESAETAVTQADHYVEEKLQRLPIRVEAAEWEYSQDWLGEKYSIRITADYRLVMPMSWNVIQTKEWMNPVLFKNRVDYLWEKGKMYMKKQEAE